MDDSDIKPASVNEKSSAYVPEVKSAVRLAVGGMTCVACVRAIMDAVSELEGVSDLSVNQVGKSASAVVTGPELVESIVTIIEDIGYECKVIAVTPVAASVRVDKTRNIAVEFKGMEFVPKEIEKILEEFQSNVSILKPYTSDPLNVLRISYTPSAPHFTIRTIISGISASIPYPISIWHPPSSDEVARQMYRKEQRKLLLRLMVAVIAAIPIFIIGIVYMSLLKADNPGRLYFQTPMWAGQVTRGEWALFILSTPVMFYAAEGFHRRSLQELWSLWKPQSRASWATRFLRFGSMNLLISLGVSVAYFSSIAELAISASRNLNGTAVTAESATYFDSVAFLTMFLLIGRFIEAFSKHQVANAITLLAKLQGSDALLLTNKPSSSSSSSFTQDTNKLEDTIHPSITKVEKISANLLEVGDIVRVPPGATPPADGTIVSLDTTNFDESSLTGESRNVMKTTGDRVFVGTINKLRMVDVRVDAIEGETMLQQVIEAVLQGQTKKAPIERIVDVVTSYFVPVVTTLAILTWIIWLSLGLSGALPVNTLENTVGGWPIWSLECAISVFVIACPCGIGLAAPTALLVGSGLAAKYGILAQGGGEAFQEASQIDVIVFDKTGTLTEGSDPKVTDVIIHGPQSTRKDGGNHQVNEANWTSTITAILLQLASASSHPLCISLRQHYQNVSSAFPAVVGIDIEELPGCGMKGVFRFQSGDNDIVEVRALLGNETWLRGQGATSDQDSEQLHRMKSQGKSIVLFALDNTTLDGISSFSPGDFSIVAVFAISDQIRPEAPGVISQLHVQEIETWMISGDNEITAQAVARSVGIPSENVIAGVLPQQKAEKIRWLQSLPRRNIKKKRNHHSQKEKRKVVAMVGDGINDAPALTAADVGIAMGSGSDIALSSAQFILLTSNLHTLLILTDLSRKVFRRINFNFVWATVYNLIAIPIAAGAIYPARHARLSPVWSSLAMALSSTSVVCSSLLLRLYNDPKFDKSATVSKIATAERKLAVEA